MGTKVVPRLGAGGLLLLALAGVLLRPSTDSTSPAAVVAADASAPAPAVTTGETIVATRVACGDRNGIECQLAGLLLAPAELKRDITFVAENRGTLKATFESASLVAVGTRSGTRITENEVPIGSTAPLEPGAVGTLTLSLPIDPAPDRYLGRVAIGIPGAEAPLPAGVDLTVRQGPLVPIILLLVGLGLGIVMRNLQSRWRPKVDAYLRWRAVFRRATLIELSNDEKAVTAARLRQIRGSIAAGRAEEATENLDDLEDSLRLFALFSALTVALGNRKDPGAEAARAKITEGRAKLRVGEKGKPDLEGASQLYQQASADARELQAQSLNETLSVGTQAPTAVEPGRSVDEAEEAGAEHAEGRWLDLLAALRWPISIALVGLALVTGLLTLYVAPATGFIGNGFADAATLILWGLGSGWLDKVFFDAE